jgi:hypothetical protein
MLNEDGIAQAFSLPPLRLNRVDVALAEPRYMVTILGMGKRFIIAPKLADVISQLQKDTPLEAAARELSSAWGQQVTSEDLCFIIKQQLIPRGLAYAKGEATGDPEVLSKAQDQTAKQSKDPLYMRLLFGRFRWRMLHRKRVRKICLSLPVLYEPLSVFLALVLIVASRYLLYSTAGTHYLRQVVARATPGEYLLGLAFLIIVVLIHEFGHAAAQVRYGLNTGSIGFQLYFYIPAFYADVSNSWSLKPRQRMVVDIGGIYFQSIAASVLCMVYLKTEFVPLLAAVVASDTLCLVSLNPFLRFDGYWLLTDALAVHNLRENSEKILANSVRRLFGLKVEGPPVLIKKGRAIILAFYAVVRNCFWLLLAFLIIDRASHVYTAASVLFSKLFAQMLKGIEVANWALLFSSVIRSILTALLLMSMASLLAGIGLRIFRMLRGAASRLLVRFNQARTVRRVARE